jgi:hypothetical protein
MTTSLTGSFFGTVILRWSTEQQRWFNDVFLAKLSPRVHLWSERFGSTGDDRGSSVLWTELAI